MLCLSSAVGPGRAALAPHGRRRRARRSHVAGFGALLACLVAAPVSRGQAFTSGLWGWSALRPRPGSGRAWLPSRAAEAAPADWAPAKVSVRDLVTGQKLQGRVSKIINMGAFVEIGAERPGFVPRNKLRSGFTSDVAEVVKVGDLVTVWVSEATPQKLIVSLVKGKAYAPQTAPRGELASFEDMLKGMLGNPEAWLTGRVARMQPYGAFVALRNPDGGEAEIQGLVHKSQIREGFTGNAEEELEIGQEVRVRVVELDMENKRLGLSMLDALGKEPGRGKAAEAPPPELEAFKAVAGQPTWLTGSIRDFTNYGAFVDVKPPDGGKEARGLLHITQIKNAFVSDVAEELTIGQEVKVRVLSIDPATGKLALSMKDVSEEAPAVQEPVDLSPFESLVNQEQWLSGTVANIAPFGAFVDVLPPNGGPTVRGLVHVSALTDGFVRDVASVVEVGQEVKVRVLAVDTQANRLGLSMQAMLPAEMETPKRRPRENLAGFQAVAPTQWLTGAVVGAQDFGAFVELPDPAGGFVGIGLVHKSQFPAEGAGPTVGEKVEVRVLNVDLTNNRMSLSMRPPEAEPEPS